MTQEDFKTWRRDLGLSQAAAARMLRVSVSSIKGWENGRAAISGPIEIACEAITERRTAKAAPPDRQ